MSDPPSLEDSAPQITIQPPSQRTPSPPVASPFSAPFVTPHKSNLTPENGEGKGKDAEIAVGDTELEAHLLEDSRIEETPSDATKDPPILSPAEEKEAKKIASMQAKVAALQSKVAEIEAQIEDIKPKLKSPDAAATVQAHIRALHRYNEIRDIGQGLLGMVAENRGVRVRDVYEEFGVGEGD